MSYSYSSDEKQHYGRKKFNNEYNSNHKNKSPRKRKLTKDYINGSEDINTDYDDLINDNPLIRSNNFFKLINKKKEENKSIELILFLSLDQISMMNYIEMTRKNLFM